MRGLVLGVVSLGLVLVLLGLTVEGGIGIPIG